VVHSIKYAFTHLTGMQRPEGGRDTGGVASLDPRLVSWALSGHFHRPGGIGSRSRFARLGNASESRVPQRESRQGV